MRGSFFVIKSLQLSAALELRLNGRVSKGTRSSLS